MDTNQGGPTVTYRQVAEIQPGPEFENTSTLGRTSETRGTSTTQPSVTYRQVAEIQPGPGFDNAAWTNSTQSAKYDYIDHIDADLAAGTNRMNRDSATQPADNEVHSGIQPDPEYENTRTQNEHDYINTGFTPGTTQHTVDNETFNQLCECGRKCKILIVVLIILIMTSVVIAIVMAHVMPAKSQKLVETGNTSGLGLLVIIGGWTYNTTREYWDTVQIYTVDEGHVRWNKYGRPAPYPWHYGGMATRRGNIYIAGGVVGNKTLRRAAKYNVSGDTWQLLSNIGHFQIMQSGNYVPAMYVIENQLYTTGGGGPSSYVEKLDLGDINSGWVVERTAPIHYVAWTNAVVIGKRAFICAGKVSYSKTPLVISWTYGDPAWTRAADMNIARDYNHGTVTDGISNIWVIGGCDPDDCWPDGFIEQYSVTNNTWTKLNHVPNLERDHYSVQVCSFWQGYIYVIFSRSLDISGPGLIPTFHVYNTQTGEWYLDSTQLTLPVYGSMFAIVPDTF